jgi:hypothetical protein
MTDILVSIELARRQRLLRQADLAKTLSVTQGHYSKVISGSVPLSGKLETRMKEWLGPDPAAAGTPDRARRMKELTGSIHAQCLELFQLAAREG